MSTHLKTKYYADLIEESAGDTKKLFSIVNSLCKVDNRYDTLSQQNSSQILANNFGAFFIQKIELIQEDIDNIEVNQPELVSYHLHAKLERFSRLTEDSVQRIIMSSSNASCTLDPMPTWLIKHCSDLLNLLNNQNLVS